MQLRKDKFGSVGLEVVEGGGGGLFVQSVLRVDEGLEQVAVGDQVLAVDGTCVLGRGYSAALNALRAAGGTVDVLLARAASPIDLGCDYLRNIRFDMAVESENFALTDVPISRPAVR